MEKTKKNVTLPVAHFFLSQAQSAELACRHVEKFLTGNPLLNYDKIIVLKEEALPATAAQFWSTLKEGLAANRAFAERMVSHLEGEGIQTVQQLKDVEKGYTSKVVHTLAHLVDGFIGIDSVLYNLVEDSHEVSETLRELLVKTPERYWLVQVRAGKVLASVLSS